MSADKCILFPGEAGQRIFFDENNPKNIWDQPCAQFRWVNCPNIKETYSDFDKESYKCEVCGYRYNLYYDEMQ